MLGLSEDQKTIKLNLKAKVVKDKEYCNGCFFYNINRSCPIGLCTPESRKDKKNIIWVEA